jgi:hypothetical protein
MDIAYLNILAVLVTSNPMMTVEQCTSMGFIPQLDI